MIVGSVGPSDRVAREVLETLASQISAAPLSISVRHGVGIGVWGGKGVASSEDHAYQGTRLGDVPAPGHELRGDFAYIGRANGCLRLASARFVGRPVYWMRCGVATVASSRLLPLALLARPRVELNLDHILAIFDGTLWVDRNPLPFVGATRVRTNTIVDITATGEATVVEGPVPLGPELRLGARDLAAALREEFSAAVSRQCQGARRVAVLAGGGVDSSNLLAIAVDNARRRGTAEVVPIAFDFGGIGDDRPHMQALCEHLRVEAVRVAPADGAPYAGRDRIVDGTIHASVPGAIVFAAMARARAEGADRALLGDGCELLLDAEPGVFGDYLRTEPLRALITACRFKGVFETRPASFRRLVLGPVLRRFLPGSVLDLRRRWLHHGTVDKAARTISWAGPRLRAFLGAPRERKPSAPTYSQRSRVQQLASNPLAMATRDHSYRWEIATGMPIVLPYLDDDFVTFAGRISSGDVFAGARERGLLRESMEGLVPDSVRYRRDKSRPFRAFEELFAAMGGHAAVRDLITMRELSAMGLVDHSKFEPAFEQFAANPGANPAGWSWFWPALTAEAYVRWFREFSSGAQDAPASADAHMAVEP